MARRSREAYLWDISDSCKAILEFTEGRAFPDYEENRMMRRAVERELSIVGEAVRQLLHHFPDLEETIGSARQIVGFRNRIIHEYSEIDPHIVWAIVQNEVPRLFRKAETLLEEPEHGG